MAEMTDEERARDLATIRALVANDRAFIRESQAAAALVWQSALDRLAQDFPQQAALVAANEDKEGRWTKKVRGG